MEVITLSSSNGLTNGLAAKKKLHKSDPDLPSLLNTSQACFLNLDPWGLMYGVSSQLASLLHFQQEELCGLPFQDLITQDFYDDVNVMIEKVQTTGGWMSMQIPVYAKDAVKVNTVVHMITSGENNERAKEVHVVFEPDSTSPGESAENSLCMQLRTPTAEVSANGQINAWNEQMMELSGFSKEDMIGRSLLDVFTVDAVQTVRHLLRLSHEIAGVSTCRTTLYTIKGIPKLIRLYAVACRDGAGQLVRIAVTAQQTNENKANAGATSTADLPTADVFNDIASETSDSSCDELRGQ